MPNPHHQICITEPQDDREVAVDDGRHAVRRRLVRQKLHPIDQRPQRLLGLAPDRLVGQRLLELSHLVAVAVD